MDTGKAKDGVGTPKVQNRMILSAMAVVALIGIVLMLLPMVLLVLRETWLHFGW